MQTPTNFTLPQIPPELGDVNPKAGDMVFVSEAGAFETDGLDGYADGRKNPFVTFDSLAFPGTGIVLPMGTTKMRFELAFGQENAGFTGHRPRRLLQR